MGLTIHYRGGLNDIDRVEDFEDRVLDFALAIGASARVWRSVSDRRCDRIVRGLIVELAPGQESTSLLISPEGWLVNLLEIEAAENGVLGGPCWCSVKTQFGPLQGHVALVELLDAIKREFMANLEVEDEGGYWRNRDVVELSKRTRFPKCQTPRNGCVCTDGSAVGFLTTSGPVVIPGHAAPSRDWVPLIQHPMTAVEPAGLFNR